MMFQNNKPFNPSPAFSVPHDPPKVVKVIDNFLLYLSIFSLLVFLYDIGFKHAELNPAILSTYYHIFFAAVLGSLSVRTFFLWREKLRRPSLIFEGLLLIVMALSLLIRLLLRDHSAHEHNLLHFLDSEQLIYCVIFYVFCIEVSKKTLLFYRSRFHPAQLFVLSFLFVIAIGTGLLMLPQATTQGISFIDALFTATSAVCVTGLATLDTAIAFTPTGKMLILILIQIGGLGIMTFASFFGIFFQGSSLQSSLFMKDWLNEDNLSQITRTLFKIVVLTLSIEFVGALLVYSSLSSLPADQLPDRFGFAIFHSISAFCNAGFSTLSLGLYDPLLRYNYPLQVVIGCLIILGGLGFPVLFAFYRYTRQMVLKLYQEIIKKQKYHHTPRLLNVNTLLVTITSFGLLILGMIVYYLLEYNNTLAEHSATGKIVGAFFGSVTPRTAGFNTVNLAELTAPTILIYLLLMWIGGSPASMSGGIKTTTFAVAILNIWSLARGKDRVEVFKREVAGESVQKAFAVMVLSLLVIGLAVFLVTLFNPTFSLSAVVFECFSGFATVGLTVGITPLMSSPSKVVLITTMFLGRVGTLTLIIGLLQKVKTLRYRYPKETIIIT